MYVGFGVWGPFFIYHLANGVSDCWEFYAVAVAQVIFKAKTNSTEQDLHGYQNNHCKQKVPFVASYNKLVQEPILSPWGPWLMNSFTFIC